ncbi:MULTISPECIES: serine hydrolase [unclassified Knoellia]|uniref:serine hydrolase n=1 Tax=Knoellia altitudinis TaxID=3404795 RepID=UPI0036205AFF
MPATYDPGRGSSARHAVENVRWLADLLAADAEPSADAADRFVDSLLERHDRDVTAMLREWRRGGPWSVVQVKAALHKGWATLEDATGARTVLALTVDTNGKIRRVIFEDFTSEAGHQGFADVDEALDALEGVESTAFVARRGPDGWTALHTRAPERPMPGGSVFKVYVLLALVWAVEEGRAQWTDELTTGPLTRSLPTGEMQDLPHGTRATLAQVAYNMYARSDNTASDMVIQHLGREEVERAVARSGHSRPESLRPFLATRELFDIGWGHPETLDTWEHSTEKERRELLDAHSHPVEVSIADLAAPAHPRGLDWWMSAADVAAAMSALWDAGARATDGPLPEILAANPGLDLDRTAWPRSTFKGGSSPGAVMFTWLLEDAEGVQHVVVLQQRCPVVGVLRDGLALRLLGDSIIHGLLT